jgi:hypothetical protein
MKFKPGDRARYRFDSNLVVIKSGAYNDMVNQPVYLVEEQDGLTYRVIESELIPAEPAELT